VGGPLEERGRGRTPSPAWWADLGEEDVLRKEATQRDIEEGVDPQETRRFMNDRGQKDQGRSTSFWRKLGQRPVVAAYQRAEAPVAGWRSRLGSHYRIARNVPGWRQLGLHEVRGLIWHATRWRRLSASNRAFARSCRVR